MRLLMCNTCKSLEELPDYEGKPENDVLLDHLVQRHRFPNGDEHRGHLMSVEDVHWQNKATREEIVKQINQRTSTGLEPEFYASKNTFMEDAAKCFAAHRRPEFCMDYKSESKRIGSPMETEGVSGASPKVYLCQFCPVETRVLTEKRKQYGAYDSTPKFNPKDRL